MYYYIIIIYSFNNYSDLQVRKANSNVVDINAKYEPKGPQNPAVKPPFSYANLITFAINSSEKRKITLSEIYSWILDNFPYYKDAGNGWKVFIISIFFVFYKLHFAVQFRWSIKYSIYFQFVELILKEKFKFYQRHPRVFRGPFEHHLWTYRT